MHKKYGRPTPIVLYDSFYFDAFGRLRVAEPQSMFDNMSEYGNNAFFWETSQNGAGSITHRPLENSLRLSTGGTTDGDYSIRQTKQYLRYQPGRSLNVEQTFVLSDPVTNGVSRIGYFDGDNGIFFERSGETLYIVNRTNVSGTPTDTKIPQSEWNVNKLIDTSQGRTAIDVTKSQILFIQMQYLGVGRVQVGFVIDGEYIVAHEFLNSNNLSTVYMSTGCLPIRGEVINSGTAGGTVYMDMICTSVSSGGTGSEKVRFTASNGITARNTSTTLLPLISMRAAEHFGGVGGAGAITNRGHIEPKELSLLVTSQSHEIILILNGSLTGASWASVDTTRSIADYDVSATAITGGIPIQSKYIGASAPERIASIADISDAIPLVYSGLGIQDILTVAVRTITSSGTALASIVWDEQY